LDEVSDFFSYAEAGVFLKGKLLVEDELVELGVDTWVGGTLLAFSAQLPNQRAQSPHPPCVPEGSPWLCSFCL
jgi:hypothetical protein